MVNSTRSLVMWRFSASAESAFLLLMPNLPVAAPVALHHQVHAGDDLGREMLHDLGVFVDQGLAFGAVGDDELHLRLRLHMSRESRAAGAHHAMRPQFLARHLCAEHQMPA